MGPSGFGPSSTTAQPTATSSLPSLFAPYGSVECRSSGGVEGRLTIRSWSQPEEFGLQAWEALPGTTQFNPKGAGVAASAGCQSSSADRLSLQNSNAAMTSCILNRQDSA